jgi:hypothetical protein
VTNTVYIYADPGERYALVRGYVGGWFRERRIPAYRSNMQNGWWIRQERVDDIVAALETSGRNVTYRRHPAPRYVPPPLPAEEQVA